MEMTLTQLSNHFYKFNEMKYDKATAIKMAKVLVEKFGCKDRKYYAHFNREEQMFDWENGDGTLFYEDETYVGKFEIGRAFGSEYEVTGQQNGLGWFCPDLEKKI